MAGDEVKRRKKTHKTHRKNGDTDASRSRTSPHPEDGGAMSKSLHASSHPADLDALRDARLTYLAKSPEERRKAMKSEHTKRTRTVSLLGEEKERRRKTRQDHVLEPKASKPARTSTRRTDHHKHQPASRADSEDGYVYPRAERESVRHKGQQSLTSKQKSKTVAAESTPRKAEARRQLPERRHTEPARRAETHDHDEQEERPAVADDLEPAPRRNAVPVNKPQRPTIKRSATTTRSKAEVSSAKPLQSAGPSRKAPSLFGGLLLPKPAPQKKVSCLTCGADDVPVADSAKLPCTHRMCTSCLKRIFTMSVKDPAHMPPRCCTDQHIDLRHVEKLFDHKFKVLWNRKFEEYKTKNRIYCPARKCGAWIKPQYITIEHGRKVGRCKQCKTRVCATCSQKMHTSRDCPKDPETRAFVEVAKKEGWQRCYNCSAMVELKEGCNHMTCRCTAEFCMVCGLKWKSCDCPWFNYQAVDAHLGDPVRHQAEMNRRREQVNRDEALARRMQQMGLMMNAGDDQDGAFGVGNAANHHLNQNFIQQAREALTANYAQAGQAARDLLNGFVMGRENRLPGMPLQMDQMLEMLGGGQARPEDPAEEEYRPDTGRRTTRRTTARRRTAAAARDRGAENHAVREDDDNERRLQEWANRARE